MSSYAKEQQVAISAVLKASLLAQKVQNELIGSGGVQKKDKSPVTGELVGAERRAQAHPTHARKRGFVLALCTRYNRCLNGRPLYNGSRASN